MIILIYTSKTAPPHILQPMDFGLSEDFIITAIVVVCIIIVSFIFYSDFTTCRQIRQKTIEYVFEQKAEKRIPYKKPVETSALGDNLQRLEKSVNNQFVYDYGLTTNENNDPTDTINETSQYIPECELDPEFITSRERIGACTTRKQSHKRCQLDTVITEDIDDESRMAVQPCNKVDESVIYKVLYNR